MVWMEPEAHISANQLSGGIFGAVFVSFAGFGPRVKPLTPLQDFLSLTKPQLLCAQNLGLALSRASALPFLSFALLLSKFETKPNNFSRTLPVLQTDTCLGRGNAPGADSIPWKSQSHCKTTTKVTAWPIYLSAFEA